MSTLSIDIETFSSVDIRKSGVYKYVESPDFEILMMAYSVDGDPVQVIDLTKDYPEFWLLKRLTDPKVLKTAYNAAFERTCLAKFFEKPMPAEQWDCTMVRAARAGYPMGLDAAAKAMGLTQEKMDSGKALIRYFSMPCKPTKANGGRTRNLPEYAPEKWNEYMDYCRQDVVVETSIRDRVLSLPVTETEKKLWVLDQKINDTGIELDTHFMGNAIRISEEYMKAMQCEAVSITGLDNPNSVAQLTGWLADQGEQVDTLRKADVKEMLEGDVDGEVRRMLEIRQEMSKTSVKKYTAMREMVCKDSRVKGLLQFYGANRTGRWAGRGVQFQNLPQNHIPDLDLARSVVSAGDGEMLDILYGNVPDTLSQLIRTSFVAGEGKRFIVADFSAIEARVIAWLAGERWRLEVFNTHGKIYEASAAQMFRIPIDQITKGSDLRQKGKVSELALGYQGGVGALEAMGALKMGLTAEELPDLVQKWRDANPAIVQLWYILNKAALSAVGKPGKLEEVNRGIRLQVKNGSLYIKLPSGRLLSYVNARLGQNRFGSPSILYKGMDQTTKQWKDLETYGGKLTENIVQAIARDCLAEAMLRLDTAGYKIVMHIHDEVVLEVPVDSGSTEEVDGIMSQPIEWAKGLPLTADSFETSFYKKD